MKKLESLAGRVVYENDWGQVVRMIDENRTKINEVVVCLNRRKPRNREWLEWAEKDKNFISTGFDQEDLIDLKNYLDATMQTPKQLLKTLGD